MDYELQIKIKNAPLLNMMRQYGIENAAQLSRKTGVSQQSIGEMLNLKSSPFMRNGAMRQPVSDVCEFFCCTIDDIWPEENLYNPLETNELKTQVSYNQLEALENKSHCPSLALEALDDEENCGIEEMVKSLTKREGKILTMRFKDKMTLEAIGQVEGVTRDRIRQIEQKALTKMRHPDRRNQILEGAGSCAEYLQ